MSGGRGEVRYSQGGGFWCWSLQTCLGSLPLLRIDSVRVVAPPKHILNSPHDELGQRRLCKSARRHCASEHISWLVLSFSPSSSPSAKENGVGLIQRVTRWWERKYCKRDSDKMERKSHARTDGSRDHGSRPPIFSQL